MQIKKYNNNSNRSQTVSFIQLIRDLELFTGHTQNRIKLNYRLLNNECIKINDNEYFKKIGG